MHNSCFVHTPNVAAMPGRVSKRYSRSWEFMREGLRVGCSNMNAATRQALLGIVAGYAAKVNKKTLFSNKEIGN